MKGVRIQISGKFGFLKNTAPPDFLGFVSYFLSLENEVFACHFRPTEHGIDTGKLISGILAKS